MDHQNFIDYFNSHDRFSIENGICLTKLGEGFAEAELYFDPACTNFMGTMHGGALFTLADVVAGTALLHHGSLCVTLSSSINYIRPSSSGKLRAVAHETHCGSKIGVCDVTIFNEGNHVVCTCTYTMYMTGKPLPEEAQTKESERS